MLQWPRILNRRIIPISPWMSVTEREVEFSPKSASQLYHSVQQQDYTAIVAQTPDGLIPIVRQYRPAVERFTWELPAGLIDPGEEPAVTCERELLEETGLVAKSVHRLPILKPCTGRLSNAMHSFFVRTAGPDRELVAEPGIEVQLVRLKHVAELVRAGEFVMQLHVGAIMLAAMEGYINPLEFR